MLVFESIEIYHQEDIVTLLQGGDCIGLKYRRGMK